MLAVAERGYPLSTPRPGWSEQDPEDWWRGAAEVLEELDASSAAGIGLSGQMHGLVALDAAGRPLRPAILWNDGRTQAQCDEIERAHRLRAPRRADRQPRAGRLHRAQAAVAGRARARGLRAHRPHPAAQGLRPPQAHRRARHRRRRRLGHAALRRRRARLERRGRPGARRRPGVAAEGLRVARRHRPDPRRRAGRRRRGRPGRGRAGRRRGGRGRPGLGRARHAAASSSPPWTATRTTPRRACTPSATPCRRRGTSWA